jgi:MoxR-like ATPase
MSYELPTISAAIDAYAVERAAEQKVPAHDFDRITPIMTDAIEKIGRQMALEGMAYADALALAEKGSEAMARDSDESRALAERAFANRSAPLPEAANDQSATAPRDAAVAPAQQEEASAAPDPAPEAPAFATAPASASGVPAPAHAAAPMGAPLVARHATETNVVPLMSGDVRMVPVLQVFPSLAQNRRAHLFRFDIPVASWEGGRVHPRVPKKKSYQFNLPDLHAALYALATDTVTNLVGPTGCGKTELVKQIANRTNMPVTLVPMDGQISRNQLIGQRGLESTPHGPRDVWRDGILGRALREPGIILLDEVDRGVSDVQYAVHSIYTGEGLTLLDDGGRVVPMHAYNRVFTTANTKGRGSMDGLYQATEEMTEATRNRLTQWIEMDYQSKVEDESVLHEAFPGIDTFAVDQITAVAELARTAFKGGTMSQSCSMRDQLETAKKYAFLSKMALDDDEKKLILADCVRMIMANRANEADKALIEANIVSTIGVDVSTHGTPFQDATPVAAGATR